MGKARTARSKSEQVNMYITLEPDLEYPLNTLSNFVCILPEPISLTGLYEVALTEFYYPVDYSVNLGSISFLVPKNINQPIYDNTDQLRRIQQNLQEKLDEFLKISNNAKLSETVLAELNSVMETYVDNLGRSRTPAIKTVIDKFETFYTNFKVNYLSKISDLYRENIKQILTAIDDKIVKINTLISESYDLIHNDRAENFQINIPHLITNNIISSDYQFLNLYSSRVSKKDSVLYSKTSKYIQTFFIFTDIISENLVLNKNQQILRIIKPEGVFGDYIEKVFHQPQYLQCNKTYISKISIQIRDSELNFINFNSGSVICKLHLRAR
jgi:hypothetical protein